MTARCVVDERVEGAQQPAITVDHEHLVKVLDLLRLPAHRLEGIGDGAALTHRHHLARHQAAGGLLVVAQEAVDVGAILHVHAWMEGIAATDINYPCGTQELAESVAELIDREPDPAHAVIGLRNHGITATGDSLTDILDRIQEDILRQVPMT